METYKRNQVEEAISRTLGERSKGPSADLLARIKRLLDTDRNETKEKGGNSAFVSIAADGQGHENKFSSYDAFAILLGLRMLGTGWSQTQVVKLLKRGRRELEKTYRRYRASEPKEYEPQLGLLSMAGVPAIGVLFPSYDHTQTDSARIIAMDDAQHLPSELRKPGQSISVFGVGDISALERNLERALPRKRGRS